MVGHLYYRFGVYGRTAMYMVLSTKGCKGLERDNDILSHCGYLLRHGWDFDAGSLEG